MKSVFAAVFLAIIAVSVYSQETDDGYLQELVAAGISQETAQGIISILSKHRVDADNDDKSGKTIFEEIVKETDEYIKTRPAADQTAYANYVAAQQNKLDNPVQGQADDDE